MGLLQKAMNEQAYLKAGIFGEPGSGKTTTASYLAMAISKRLGGGKPVAVFETEAGSDFTLSKFQVEGVELLRVKSHSLKDLIEVVGEAEKTCSALLVDSITHVWDDVCEAKLRAINAAREKKCKANGWKFNPLDKLEFQHWADVKRQWKVWTDLFLNSRLHIIVCGRAGGVYEFSTNEDTNKKELQKVGTKMRAEGQFGYEPSLLIEMERTQQEGASGGWNHRAVVLKDRTDTINGLAFAFSKPTRAYKPGDWEKTFKPFEPVFKSLNIGGEQRTYDVTRSAEELFPGAEGESNWEERKRRVEIALEEIQGTLSALWPGMSAAEKALKATAVEALFSTRSWTKVTTLSLEELERALLKLRELESRSRALGGAPADPESLVVMMRQVSDQAVVSQ